jgi:hypothetical protein
LKILFYTKHNNAFKRNLDIVSQAGKDLYRKISREIENNSNPDSGLPGGDFIDSWRYFVEPQGVIIDH